MAETDRLRDQNTKLDRDLKAALASLESLNKELEVSKTAHQAESVQMRQVIDSLSAQVQSIYSQNKDSDNRT
jgi:septal ring factor EnvC (AmiA/AmiB activator)